MTIIETVKKKLGIEKDAGLARLLRVNRSCIWEWKQRLAGGIPSRHYDTLLAEAKRLKVKLSYAELRGR